jgi:hypothetical protein
MTGWLFEAANLPFLGKPSEDRQKWRHRKALQGSRELEMGRAAEHLVCADLLLGGWAAYPAAQGMPYDLVVDVGNRLVRLQVKSTYYPKNPQPKSRANPAYFFHIRRAGRGGGRLYRANEFDAYALVALDRRLIAYFATAELPKQYAVMRIPGGRYGHGATAERDFESATFARVLTMLQQNAAASDAREA